MIFPSKEIVEQVRRQYPVGTRVELVKMDEKKIHSIIDEAMAARDRSVSIYISPDGGVSVSVFPWPDEETLRNMRASGLISHNDYRTRLGLSPMKD